MPVAVEFSVPVLAARTTCKLLPYAKKDAAVKNDAAVLLSGALKVLTRTFSDPTLLSVFTGPQLKAPAYAPAVVRTEGTTVVKLVSVVITPGDN